MSEIADLARAAGHDVEMHELIGALVDDDMVDIDIVYATTQQKSRAGRSRRVRPWRRRGRTRAVITAAAMETRA